MQVPVEVSCYREVIDKAVEFYDYHIELECQEKIAAAKVLMETNLGAEEIAKKSIKVASEICVFTNNNITTEKI